tara:strand:+ start:13856 stop:14269 length:414 start_codon:yes stop_codon:yes gene_type:complete
MKRFKNTTLIGQGGNKIQYAKQKEGAEGSPCKICGQPNLEWVDAKLYNILAVILNNTPIKTMPDSIQGGRLADVLEEVEKKKLAFIEIEEGVHDWLKPIVKEIAPPIFRLGAQYIYDHICGGFEKEHQPEREKSKAS